MYQLKDEEDVKVGVLKLMLKNKIDDGLAKPKSFRFKDLINLTMIYFSNAAWKCWTLMYYKYKKIFNGLQINIIVD